MPLLSLPNEIFLQIAKDLVCPPEECAQHLNSLLRVNRRLYTLLSDELYKIGATTIVTGGKSVLHWAAEHRKLGLVGILLEHGSSIDARDIIERTPLHYAARYNSREIVKLLIDKGANIEARDNKYAEDATPLHIAAKNGCKDAVEELLENGADINCLARHNNTALHLAVQNDREQIVSLLLERSANIYLPNNSGNIPIQDAVERRNHEVIRIFISHGPDPEIETKLQESEIYVQKKIYRIGLMRELFKQVVDFAGLEAEFNETLKSVTTYIHGNRVDISQVISYRLAPIHSLENQEAGSYFPGSDTSSMCVMGSSSTSSSPSSFSRSQVTLEAQAEETAKFVMQPNEYPFPYTPAQVQTDLI